MIDFGFDKLALIGAVALIVIGPERLPKVARTVGHLLGKAQRYVADVKAEVNRSIELEELQKMRGEFESGVRDMEKSLSDQIHQTSSDLNDGWKSDGWNGGGADALGDDSGNHIGHRPVPTRTTPRKNWRLKRGAMPQWYKQRHGVRSRVQSAAARVARFRPRRSTP